VNEIHKQKREKNKTIFSLFFITFKLIYYNRGFLLEENYLRKTIPIDRMDCASCAQIIEKEMKKLEGVKDVSINLLMRKVVVTYDPEKIDESNLEKKIEDLGYRISYKKYESVFNKILKIFKRKPKKRKNERNKMMVF